MQVSGPCIACKEDSSDEKKDEKAWLELQKLCKDWDTGPKGHYLHKICRLKMQTQRERARNSECAEKRSREINKKDTPKTICKS